MSLILLGGLSLPAEQFHDHFRCILVHFVPCAGNDQKFRLWQELFQLFGGGSVRAILFTAEEGDGAFDFLKITREIQFTHGMSQIYRIAFRKPCVGKCLVRHPAEQQILEVYQQARHFALHANQNQRVDLFPVPDGLSQCKHPTQRKPADAKRLCSVCIAFFQSC